MIEGASDTPVVVEHEGWTVTSNHESADSIKESLKPAEKESAEDSVKSQKVDERGRVHEQDGKFKAKPIKDAKPPEKGKTEAKAPAPETSQPAKPAEKAAPPEEEAAEEVKAEEKPDEKQEQEKRRRDARWRVEQATRQAAELKREREALRAENERLRALAEARTAPQEQPRQESRGDGRPTPDQFQSYEEYLDARDDFNKRQWTAELRANAEREIAQRQISEHVSQFQKAIQDEGESLASEVDPELLDLEPSWVVRERGESVTPLNALADEIIAAGKQAPALLRYFSEHVEDRQRLSTLPPYAFAREMGRIMAKLEGVTAAKPPEPPTYKPADFKPLRAVSGAPHSADTSDEMEMDFDSLAALRAKQGANRARR